MRSETYWVGIGERSIERHVHEILLLSGFFCIYTLACVSRKVIIDDLVLRKQVNMDRYTDYYHRSCQQTQRQSELQQQASR